MNNMKIILENWKRFEKEALLDSNAGNIYSIGERGVKKACFLEALNSIGETQENIELFLEKWEKSLDYELQKINEIDLNSLKQNPVLHLSTQVFMMLQKFKDKAVNYAAQIISGANKIKKIAQRFESSNPRIYKAGMLVGKITIALIAMYAVQSLFGSTDAMAGNLMDDDQVIARAKKLLSVAKQIAESSTDDPELQKIGTFFEKVASGDDFDAYYRLSSSQKEQLEAIASRDLHTLKKMAQEGDSDALRRVADSALEVFKDASDIEIPQAPQQNAQNLDLGAILDQVEMMTDLNKAPKDDMVKLLNLAAEKEKNPELKKRALDLLNQINP
tara:strand:+ start:12839 stop:13831 length:993 start_codon:yes stop_codon:yes gene_type:complete